MKQQFFLSYLVSLTIYLTVGLILSAGASPHPSGRHGTHSHGVIDHWGGKRYSDQYPNRRYARSFAANQNVGDPRTVRLIYFRPNDRPHRPAVVQRMKDEILNIQTFFAEQMEEHGYGRRTFRVETDAEDEPMVHRVVGKHPDSYYFDGGDYWQDMEQEFDRRSNNVYCLVWDRSTNSVAPGVAGTGGGGRNGGQATVTSEFHWTTMAHELGHAFGLGHDFRDGRYIMSYGPGEDQLSVCAADFLSVHPYFNPNIPIERGDQPTIELISSPLYPAGSRSVRVRLKVSDSDGLHQVLLHALGDLQMCHRLTGQTDAIIDFDYDGGFTLEGFTSLSDTVGHSISIEVVDKDGDVGYASFTLAEISPYHIATLGHTGSVYSVAFSPDGGTLAAGTSAGGVKLWDVTMRTNIATLPHTGNLNSVAFSSDGTTLASGSRDGEVKLWDVTMRTNIATLRHPDRVTSVAFSPDGTTLAYGLHDRTVKLWDITTQTNIATLEHNDWVWSVAFSPDGTTLASGVGGDWEGAVKLWDVTTRTDIATLEEDGYVPWVLSVAFSPDGAILASGTGNGERWVKLWDVSTRRNIAFFEHRFSVTSVSFSPDGTILAAGERDGTVKLRDVATYAQIAILPHTSEVWSVSFSPDGATLASATAAGTIELWDMTMLMDVRVELATEIDIPDSNLRAAIEKALDKASPITQADMARLTTLYANDSNISDLTGLEHATNLTYLSLGDAYVEGEGHVNSNSISNLSPLSRLTNLTHLTLNQNNITDISAVVGLTNLTWLDIGGNSLSDISPVTGLINLTGLRLWRNNIVDISPVTDLIHLTELNLNGNNIADLSPLAELTSLARLRLQHNNISDLSPLVENTGLGNGDEVNVEQNLLNYVSLNTVIPALQDKKVQIRFTRRTPGDVLIISGIDQQGEPGVTLDRPFVVEVRDETGVPFEGVPVAFTVTAGGGTVQPETVHTGSDGLAETTLTLGNTPGANTVLATVDGITEPVTFNAVGEVSDLVVDLPSVSKSTLAPGEKFTLSVTVRNQENRRADGTTLRYYRSTDATISSSDTEVGTASVSGLDANEDSDYSISLTAPTAAGVYYYGACVDTVDNETITANNCADGVEITVERVPTELVKLSGDNQSGVISQMLSSPFVVEVRDQDQTPLEAVPVMFAVIAGGGMLSATHTNTDASGLAETTLTLGSTPGTNTVLATVDGIAEPVTFNAVGEGIEFDLSMSAGTNLIHVPLQVSAVDGVAKTIESISDLYDALGGTNAVNFLITYDTSTQTWLSYLSSADRGSASDRGLTDEMGIIAGMKTAVTVRLRGEALGIAGSSAIALNQGLNLVGLPLRDPTINRVSDLLRLDGIWGNVDRIILNDGGDFKIVARAGDPGDIPITGGQGFILTADQAATVTLSGEGWTNVTVPAATPKLLTGLPVTNTTAVLALKGSIVDEVSAVNRVGFRVAVKNLSTGRQVVTTIADAEAGYRLAVVDIETMRAAEIGDVLDISAQSFNPFIGVQPLQYTVTVEDVKQGWIQLPALVAYEIPTETELLANYPNPFNPETWIPYRLAEDADVKLTIYDANGRVVRSLNVGHRVAAVYESRSKAIYWDGRNEIGEGVASGVYFYHLLAGSYSQTRKMLILK